MHITIIPKNPDALQSTFCTPTDSLSSDALKFTMAEVFPAIQSLPPVEQHERNLQVALANSPKSYLPKGPSLVPNRWLGLEI